jgi:hypothetical protein
LPKFLDSTEPEKISYHTVIGWVKDKRIQSYLVPLGFSFVVSSVFFIILIQWFAIDMLLITADVMLFGILSEIVIQIRKKQGE